MFPAALLTVALAQPRPTMGQAPDPFPVHATDACSANQWLIPFGQGTAELSEFAQKRLDAVAAAWRVDGGPVLASGRVDGTEEGHDPDLARRRSQAVTEGLVKRGVPPDALWPRDDGGARGFVENRPGSAEPQNRIVLATLVRGGSQCARAVTKARVEWMRRNCSATHPKLDSVSCDDALSRLD